MKNLLQVVNRALGEGRDLVLVTIVSGERHTPGREGFAMAVSSDGRLFGTIGGGAVELRSEQRALQLLKEKKSVLETFRLYPNDTSDIGMVCGGDNDVWFRYISAGDESVKETIRTALARIENGQQAWFVMEVSGNGAFSLYSEKDGLITGDLPEELYPELKRLPAVYETAGRRFFARRLMDDGQVYLFGGGHISQALAPILVKLGFECTVADDREEFTDPALFGGAKTCRINPADISALTERITDADYICIMTHGHKDDYEIQRQVMKTEARYIGVIGSARKQNFVRSKLFADGYTEEDFANVVSPIGLNIGADTAEEIAVSIAAQLIMVRSGRGCGEKDWKR